MPETLSTISRNSSMSESIIPAFDVESVPEKAGLFSESSLADTARHKCENNPNTKVHHSTPLSSPSSFKPNRDIVADILRNLSYQWYEEQIMISQSKTEFTESLNSTFTTGCDRSYSKS